MKRDVITVFLMLMVLTLFLGAMQFLGYGGVTGYSVFDSGVGDINSGVEGYDVIIDTYVKVDQGVKVFYRLVDGDETSRVIDMNYFLEDDSGKVVLDGKSRFVLQESSELDLVLDLPSKDLADKSLVLKMNFEDEFGLAVKKEVIIGSRGLAGFSVYNDGAGFIYLPMVVFVFIMGLIGAILLVHNRLERRSDFEPGYSSDYRKGRMISIDGNL